MWEAIKDVLTNSFGLVALIIIAVFIIVLLVLSKKGFFTISTKAVRIGTDTNTRLLIERQLGYVKSKMIELLTEPAIKSHTKTEYKLRYIISEVKDVFERSVIFNNMSLSNAYIESKQIAAYAAIIPLLSRDTDDEYFFTQDFKDFVYRKTEDIVKGLVELKESK